MSLRDYLQKLENQNNLIKINKAVSKTHEIAGVLKELEPKPVIFNNVTESNFQVVGNLFCSKASFANYFDISPNQIIPLLTNAINNRNSCEIISNASCQEIVMDDPDLDKLPILKHCQNDGGNYISSGIVITKHPQYGQNMDFHRFMQFSKTELAARIVKTRHFDTFLRDQGSIEVAVCIGNSPNIMAAAATSVEIGIDELDIANALEPVQLVRAKTCDLYIPAESEIILEGIVHLERKHSEGPFVDLTETYDIIREEPIFEVKAITHRKDAIWQALLPGALEHKLLMGMPREPTILKKVNEVVKCLDVNINPGGCSWLHAIVQIDKQNEEDGKKALHAAFAGHRSCKHVFVVDKDIDIYNPLEVEWAMATRFQGHKNMLILERERGSSLDPSADSGTHLTSKIGFDLTMPLDKPKEAYEKARFPQVNIQDYLETRS